ncbi:hypothetical protein [Microbacterium binotii]|uniref:DUF2029 domain-containing protein n=1 Tax=Microbacterium binotii TaxID=462710 RepID=A0ABP6BGG3_9MICO
MSAVPTEGLRRVWRSCVAVMRGERGVLRWIAAVVVVYALAQIVFLLSTVAAAAVPNTAVVAALAQGASQHLWNAIDYPADGIGHVTQRFSFAGVSDAFTQCIALTMQTPGGDGAWESAMAGRHLGTCSLALPSITEMAAGGSASEVYTYNRYWNGFTLLTRPALALGGVGAVRVSVAVLLIVAVVVAAIVLSRRVSPLAPLVLVPVFLSTNIATSTMDAFPHALSFAVILFGMAAGARFATEPLPSLVIVAALSASVFNFVDFLLNPPVAWALFVFAAVAARWRRGDRPRPLLAAAGAAGLGWIAGYAATWVTRWVLAVLTFGDSAWQEILSVISTRLQGQNPDLVTPGPFQPTLRNTLFWLGTIPTSRFVAVAALVVVIVSLVIVLVQRRWRALGMMAVLAAPAVLVPVWLELLNNHSQIHVFFVYRAIPVAVGIVAISALLVAVGRRATPTVSPGSTIRIEGARA